MSKVNSINTGQGNPDATLDSIIQSAQAPKPPGTFRRILGAAAGIGGNIFFPGMGSILSSIIGGSGINSASTDPTQYLRLQQQMNAQSEVFQSISGVLKAKHDTAMAAINNLK
jgi:hypothetical protein